MFRAIGRFFRAILYSLTGNFDYWAEVWEGTPAAISAKYDAIEREHTVRIQEVKKAVASIMGIQSGKQQRLKSLSVELEKFGRLLSGAMALAQKRVQILQSEGKTPEQIQGDTEYLKCKSAFSDFSSTLEAKKEESSRLHQEVDQHERQLADYEASLQSMVRELQTIRQEKHETVADVQIAKQEKEANDLLAGISQSRTSEERLQMQQMRQRIKSEAGISRKLAGIESQKTEQEFLNYAIANDSGNEFDRIMGLAPKIALPNEQVASETTKVPDTVVLEAAISKTTM
jgi:chromosome segregation ATPase